MSSPSSRGSRPNRFCLGSRPGRATRNPPTTVTTPPPRAGQAALPVQEPKARAASGRAPGASPSAPVPVTPTACSTRRTSSSDASRSLVRLPTAPSEGRGAPGAGLGPVRFGADLGRLTRPTRVPERPGPLDHEMESAPASRISGNLPAPLAVRGFLPEGKKRHPGERGAHRAAVVRAARWMPTLRPGGATQRHGQDQASSQTKRWQAPRHRAFWGVRAVQDAKAPRTPCGAGRRDPRGGYASVLGPGRRRPGPRSRRTGLRGTGGRIGRTRRDEESPDRMD